MALDHLFIGPLLLQMVDRAYMGQPSEPGALAAGYLYDPASGEFARDLGGSVYQFAAPIPLSITDIPDTTDLRARLVEDVLGQFVNVGAIDAAAAEQVTAVWSDWTPPPSP
ncbi:hypothetical protein [Nocardia farcinica]|uniref:hypothetical protein n=1 Tax=Nocardia farcinica TaxID=37329 RepID=UPI001893A19A|nr:hypothetical protein [Nocardia farcinica]MBF6411184.1 hypothetical protein [Nocardia farcinica]